MSVAIYDPTAADAQSAVRGIGRYLQLLRENLPDATYTGALHELDGAPSDVFILPFLNLIQSPTITKRFGKKQIGVIHDLIPLKYPNDFPIGIKGKINSIRAKQTLKLYDLIVTDSEASKADIIKILGVHEEKIRVIYPCLPEALCKKAPSKSVASPGVPYFVYVGDATPNKNLVLLARSIQASSVTCVFAGKVFVQGAPPENGWTKELNEFLKISKGDDRFKFTGFISDEELLGLYNGAIANVLLSKEEGFGFSFLEAAHCGTPSLLADRPIFRETAQESALFTSVTSGVTDVDAALQKLASDKKLRDSLGDKAQKRSNFFSAEKFKKQWEEILK